MAAGCGGPASPLAPHAEAFNGPYRLVFELPRTIWRTTEAIEGQATLSLAGRGGVDLSGEYGLIGFEFVEIGLHGRHMPLTGTLMCYAYRLDADRPITTPIIKTAAWSSDDPNADFYKQFIYQPGVHLSPGIWTVTAIADFSQGARCEGPGWLVKATVTILVTF